MPGPDATPATEPSGTPTGTPAAAEPGGVPAAAPAADPTVLEGGAPAAAPGAGGTVLEGGAPADPNAAPEIPEKFRKEDGTLDTEKLQSSYKELSDKLHAGGAPPKDVEGYDIKVEMPEGVELDKEGHAKFLDACLEQGMNNKQVQFVMDQATAIMKTGAEIKTATNADVTAELQKSWGEDYDKNIGAAFAAFNALADESDRASIKEIGNNPAMIRILAKAGANLSEDILPGGQPAPGNMMTTSELESVMKSDAYRKADHPDHAAAMEKVTRHHKATAKVPKKM